MLANGDLEKLIAAKKRELLVEKSVLGLSPPPQPRNSLENEKENSPSTPTARPQKQVTFVERPPLRQYIDVDNRTESFLEPRHDPVVAKEDFIPPDLERYIRRYVGLPVMLKTGEYSPNNPLLKGDTPRDRDAFIGLGDYERRNKTLRKLRQQEYRQYLDQQAKKKQEERARAERETRERERRERERDATLRERERQHDREKERKNYRIQRADFTQRLGDGEYNSSPGSRAGYTDASVQVGPGAPLSVAVQTDPSDFYTPTERPKAHQAERELSPRTGIEPAPAAGRQTPHDERPVKPAPWINESRRRSYGDYDERTCAFSNNPNRNMAHTEQRHPYMPSIFDEDAIQQRNNKAEQEAAERRMFYQKELKNQIEEQQRIKEERKAREKMLEMAEMRRLEEQLKMLRMAQDKESKKNEQITCAMKENARQYENKRTTLQKEIESEQKSLLRAITQPAHFIKRSIYTSKSDNAPLTCKLSDLDRIDRKPYSTNIPDSSIFSPSYDVDNYLRLNLNPSKESLMSNQMEGSYKDRAKISHTSSEVKDSTDTEKRRFSFEPQDDWSSKETVVEKALVHDEPKVVKSTGNSNVNKSQCRSEYEPSFLKKDVTKIIKNSPLDEIPIPVLRHSPKLKIDDEGVINEEDNSEAMKRLEDKWKVPAVQRNILKSLPKNDGNNVSILTQLGSIRRQLQMEQLKLDTMLSKGSDV